MAFGLYTTKMGTQITQIAYDKIRFLHAKSYLIISNLRYLRSHFLLGVTKPTVIKDKV
jgi:hypothetical protein